MAVFVEIQVKIKEICSGSSAGHVLTCLAKIEKEGNCQLLLKVHKHPPCLSQRFALDPQIELVLEAEVEGNDRPHVYEAFDLHVADTSKSQFFRMHNCTPQKCSLHHGIVQLAEGNLDVVCFLKANQSF